MFTDFEIERMPRNFKRLPKYCLRVEQTKENVGKDVIVREVGGLLAVQPEK